MGVHLFIILSGGRRVGARPGAWEAVVYGFDVHRLFTSMFGQEASRSPVHMGPISTDNVTDNAKI